MLKFISVLITAHSMSLSWGRSVQPMSLPTLFCWRLILILSFYLCLGLPSSCLPSGFPAKTMYALLLFSVFTTCLAPLTFLYLISLIIFDEDNKSWNSSIWNFIQFPVTSSLLVEIRIHILKLVNKQFIFFLILISLCMEAWVYFSSIASMLKSL